MSIYKPEELRYIKLDSVRQERAYFRNIWNDIINQYGIDVEYYRRNTNYVTPDESSAMLYGHNNVAVYDKKSNIRVKVEYNVYDFILNEQGFVPNDNLVLYFGINDFATSFVDEIGQFKEYPLRPDIVEGYAKLDKDGCIRIPFETQIYSGIAVVPIESGDTVKSNVFVEDVEEPTRRCLSVAYNPYIFRSFATDYRDGYYSLNLYCDYDASRGSRIKYKLHGGVLYSDFFEDEEVVNKIHPNPGDVIEINYHTNDMDIEQYEITEVISRKPTAQDGISPMLGKCVFKCAAVRRIASHEDTIPTTDDTKKSSDAQKDYSKKRADAINKHYDWDNPEKSYKSNVYGGYAKADAYFETVSGNLSAHIDQIFDYDQWKYDWPDSTLTSSGRYDICDFTDGTKLWTDGVNLMWEGRNGVERSLTTIEPSSVHIENGEIPNMMYIRLVDGQIVYNTADLNTSVQLTHFEHPTPDAFQYFENFAYKDVGYVSNEGYYIFRNNRVAFNSFDEKYLVAFDGRAREQYLIATFDDSGSEDENT